MNYNEFKEEFTKQVQIFIGETGDLQESKINKLSAPNQDALSLRFEGLAPTIYVQDAYAKHLNGGDVKSLANEAAKLLIEGIHRDISLPLINETYVMNHIQPRVVSTVGNEEFIADKPHTRMDDLSILYAMDIEGVPGGSVWITDDMIVKFHLTQEELHEQAVKNMDPPVIASMSSILGLPMEDNGMLVVTNLNKLYGAAEALLSPTVQKELYDKLGDYVVIPSSVHEVIVVPADLMPPEDLKGLVKEVNDTQVEPRDRLSYNIYQYDPQSCRIGIYQPHKEPSPAPKLAM